VTAHYPKPNARKASIRLLNRFSDNTYEDRCSPRYKH
jgi:hypothetical protein